MGAVAAAGSLSEERVRLDRPISSRLHGFIDYGVGGLLIAAPWILGFATGGPAMWIAVMVGASTLAYSLLTDYELGLKRWIPLSVHLGLDVLGGVLLALSPWIFNFADAVFWPHVLVGVTAIGIPLLTRKRRPRPQLAGTMAHPG